MRDSRASDMHYSQEAAAILAMESIFQTRKRRERAIASLGVFGLAVALYTNSLAGDFVFDDHTAIEINPDVRWVRKRARALMRKQRSKLCTRVGVGVTNCVM